MGRGRIRGTGFPILTFVRGAGARMRLLVSRAITGGRARGAIRTICGAIVSVATPLLMICRGRLLAISILLSGALSAGRVGSDGVC